MRRPATTDRRPMRGSRAALVATLLALAGAPRALPAQALAVTELLGRPSDSAIALSVAAGEAFDAFVEWGAAPGSYDSRSDVVASSGTDPVVLELSSLQPDRRYYYRSHVRRRGAPAFTAGPEHTFHTRRARGSTFTFDVFTDSHLGTPDHCDPELYARALGNALADRPDFFLDLGDTFRADHIPVVNPATVADLYVDQRAYFGLLAHSAPLFLAVGNHEAASGWLRDGTPDTVAIWATTARQTYFLNPLPDGFYSGNGHPDPIAGLLGDYYAWEWGDALFVVIDPYWYTTRNPRESGDQWDWTLGEEQFRWLERTLAGSRARFKFVFAHHVHGDGSRGGVEPAALFEWGGRERNGSWTFPARRPGWDLPVHQVMARAGVTAFFQGHDHIFVRQELDGVVYQTCPMPADPFYRLSNADFFRSGVKLPNSGHVRVTVSPAGVTVDYVRAWLPEDETPEHPNGEVAYSYTIPGGPTPRAPRRRPGFMP